MPPAPSRRRVCQHDAALREAAAYWTVALRSFLADARQFAPKDDAALRADMALTQAALTRDGLTPVVARVVDVSELLPTYLLIYKTKPDANPDHESRLRMLAPGDDLDFGVFRAAGLDVVETPRAWMMVYVVHAAGYVSLAAKTSQDLAHAMSVTYLPTMAEAAAHVQLLPGSVVVAMGAGSITQLPALLLDRLRG